MNQTALVTGASSGIGAATAKALQKKGLTVYAGARRLERMEPLKALGIRPLKLDVTEEASMQAVMRQIEQESGGVDVLVNNAGYGAYGAVEDVPMSDARRQMEVNLFGLARLTQLALPHMRQQRGGKIVNVTSIGGKIALPFGGWYHASKYAVEGLSDALRNEVREFGVDVILIEPGGVRTEWGEIAMGSLAQNAQHSPYQDLAERTLRAFAGTENGSAEPEVIGDLIARAVTAAHPRARYSAGNMSGIIFLRRFISDGLFDRLIMSQLRG